MRPACLACLWCHAYLLCRVCLSSRLSCAYPASRLPCLPHLPSMPCLVTPACAPDMPRNSAFLHQNILPYTTYFTLSHFSGFLWSPVMVSPTLFPLYLCRLTDFIFHSAFPHFLFYLFSLNHNSPFILSFPVSFAIFFKLLACVELVFLSVSHVL